MTRKQSRELLLTLMQGPAHYAHYTAKEIAKHPRSKERWADLYLGIALQWYDIQSLARLASTWLNAYDLDIDMQQVKAFDEFHSRTCSYITGNSRDKNLKPYEAPL